MLETLPGFLSKFQKEDSTRKPEASDLAQTENQKQKKELTEEQKQAVQEVLDQIKFGFVDGAKKLLKNKILKGVDLRSFPDYENTIRENILRQIEKVGRMDRALEIKKSSFAKDIDVSEANNYEQRIKDVFMSSLKRGYVEDALILKKEFAKNIDLKTIDGYEDVVKTAFALVLEKGQIEDAKAIQKELAQGIELKNIDGFKEKLEKGFVTCLAEGKEVSVDNIKNSNFSEGVDLLSVAKNGLVQQVEEGQINGAINIKGSKFIKEKFLSDAIKKGVFGSMETRAMNSGVPAENQGISKYLDSKNIEGYDKTVKEKFLEYLKEGNHNAIKIKKDLAPEIDFESLDGYEEAVREGFVKSLDKNNLYTTLEFKNELAKNIDLSKEIKEGFINFLEKGAYNMALDIKESGLLEGFLKNIEGYDEAVKEGLKRILEAEYSFDIKQAIKFKNEFAEGIDLKEIIEEAIANCTEEYYDKKLDNVRLIKNSELMTGIDLKNSDVYKNAVNKKIAVRLKYSTYPESIENIVKFKKEFADDIDITESVELGLLDCLDHGTNGLERFIEFTKSEIASGFNFDNVINKGIKNLLMKNRFWDVKNILNIDLAKNVVIEDLVKQSFVECLQNSDGQSRSFSNAVELRQSDLAKDVNFDEVKDLEKITKDALWKVFKKGDIDKVSVFKELGYIKSGFENFEDYEETIKKVFVEKINSPKASENRKTITIKEDFSKGIDLKEINNYVDVVKEAFQRILLDKNLAAVSISIKFKNELAEGIDLTKEIKTACLKFLKIGDADYFKEIKNSELSQDLDFQNDKDYENAAREGLKFLLEREYGSLDDVVKLKNSEILKNTDLGDLEEIVNKKLISSLSHGSTYLENIYQGAKIAEKNLTKDNWVEVLAIYGVCHMEDENNRIQKEIKTKMKELFPENNADNRNFIFDKLYEVYKKILNEGEESISPKEQAILEVINTNGAGNMSLVESLGEFMHQLNKSFQAKTTVGRTKQEIRQGLQKMENIADKQNWDVEEKSYFYKVGKDVLDAAPSLFSSYIYEVIPKLSKVEQKLFFEKLWPLHHIEIVLNGGTKNNARILAEIRENFRAFNNQLDNTKENEQKRNIFENEESRLLENIKVIFKEKMGIIKIPEKLNENHVESIKKYGTYLVNMAGKDNLKGNLLGFMLALKLNGKWEEFRENLDSIDVNEYMAPEVAGSLKEYIKLRSQNDIFKDISPETMQKVEEEQVSAIMGNVQTIDLRLQSINSNIKELADEDIFEGKEKDVLRIVNKYGKQSGASLSAKFRELEKGQPVSPEQQEILDDLQKAFEIEIWTKENVKEVQKLLSDTMPNKIINLVNKLGDIYEKEKVEEKIDSLNKEKIPTEEVVKIFQKLGEDFTSESGIVPIGNDVHYLMTLIEKEENKKKGKKISEEEIKTAKDYLAGVGDKIRNLESVWAKLYEMVKSFEKNTENSNNEQLKDRFDSIKSELEKSIGTEARNIVGIMTCDLEEVINNIRACLKCTTNGCNNDTNLSFGDRNRFFLYCKNENSKKSFADQLVTVLPTKKENNEQKLHFVMDNVYGERVPDVLVLNTLNVLKKLKAINDKKFEIFVTDAAMSSTNVSDISYLENRLKENTDIPFQIEKVNNITVTVPEKSAEDAYHEFGGGARSSGDRQVSGYVIKLK